MIKKQFLNQPGDKDNRCMDIELSYDHVKVAYFHVLNIGHILDHVSFYRLTDVMPYDLDLIVDCLTDYSIYAVLPPFDSPYIHSLNT